MTTGYTQVFGGSTVPPAGYGYSAINISADTTTQWPYNYSGSGVVISKIIDVTCGSGNSLLLPSANQVSAGEDTLIRNVGANTLTVKDFSGNVLATVAVGVAQFFFLTSNSTPAGTWGSITYGAGSSSVSAGALAGFGLVALSSTLNTSKPISNQGASFTVTSSFRDQVVNMTGGATVVSLTSAATLGNNFFFNFKNSGTGTSTVTPNAGDLIDGQSTMTFQPGESAIIACSGSGWFTVGYGRSTVYQFSQLVLDVSAAGTFTLSSAQASNKMLTFTGTPAGSVTIVVPNTVAVYYVVSNISTAQNITIKTATGAGTTLSQSQRGICLCDATDVSAAQSAAATTNLSIIDGSVSSPSFYFASDTQTGIYKYSTHGFGISVLGSAALQADVTGVNFPVNAFINGVQIDTISGANTLTNKVISGASNTLTNIPWASITGVSGNVLLVANNLSDLNNKATARANLTPLTTKGDIWVFGAIDARLPVGVDGQTLVSDSSQSSGLRWASQQLSRNRVINGDHRVDQTGLPVFGGGANTVNSNLQFLACDMWSAYGTAAAGVYTVQQQSATPPAGFKNYIRAIVTVRDAAPAAGSYYLIDTRIEGFDVADFMLGSGSAITFTTQVQLRSSVTGTFSGSFKNAAGTRSYPWTCVIAAANTWTPIVITVPGDQTGVWATDNTIGLQFVIDLGCGSTYRSTGVANNAPTLANWQAGVYYGVTGAIQFISQIVGTTLDIAAVQIEPGPVATPFERRDYASELARCMRYGEVIDITKGSAFASAGWQAAGGGVYSSYTLKGRKRASPLWSLGSAGWSTANAGVPTQFLGGTDQLTVLSIIPASSAYAYYMNSGYIYVDARL